VLGVGATELERGAVTKVFIGVIFGRGVSGTEASVDSRGVASLVSITGVSFAFPREITGVFGMSVVPDATQCLSTSCRASLNKSAIRVLAFLRVYCFLLFVSI
jgi:hypothetical protein